MLLNLDAFQQCVKSKIRWTAIKKRTYKTLNMQTCPKYRIPFLVYFVVWFSMVTPKGIIKFTFGARCTASLHNFTDHILRNSNEVSNTSHPFSFRYYWISNKNIHEFLLRILLSLSARFTLSETMVLKKTTLMFIQSFISCFCLLWKVPIILGYLVPGSNY